MIKMLEVAKASQLVELSNNIHETQGIYLMFGKKFNLLIIFYFMYAIFIF